MSHLSEHAFRTLERYWTDPEWLAHRMLFLSGARQVGKTTLVRSALCPSPGAYFNWDSPRVRRAYRQDPDFFVGADSEWVCFDEIHKRPKWKDILKGLYDVHGSRFRFVVTGSARLDVFKRSGDSLVGRYFLTHLFPLNVSDLVQGDVALPDDAKQLLERAGDAPEAPDIIEGLVHLGGFPEPFFSGSERFRKRWSSQHRDLILSEDLRDLSRIVEFDKLESLLELLTPMVGSTVSNARLAQEVETTHGTIKRWLLELSKVQLIFALTPYFRNIRRSLRKEKKWYFYDWCAAKEHCFENLVAATLRRAVTLWSDRFGEALSLHYVRTHDKTEVDFLIARDGAPWLIVEAKRGRPEITHAVSRFADELGIPAAVVTLRSGFNRRTTSPGGQAIFQLSWSKLARLL